jgi:hypothetical protein
MRGRTHRAALAGAIVLLLLLQFPASVAGGHLVNCVGAAGQPHFGGNEHDPSGTARGVSGVITVRTLDLCNNPIDQSGTTGYVMLNNLGDGISDWFQIGFYRVPGDTCARRSYTQLLTAGGVLTDRTGPCMTSGVKYRLRIERMMDDGVYWRPYILVESTLALFWDAPAPESLGFTIDDTQYSYEVLDEADQAGGGNASRGKLESAYWKNSSEAWVPADMPAADRMCNLCGAAGHYNTNWLTNRAFEAWTDGF